MSQESQESVGGDHPNKGRLFKELRPQCCNNCDKTIPHRKRAIFMDIREFTEDGWLPHYQLHKDVEEHWFWVFCSCGCLKSFMDRVVERKVDIGLKG